MQCATTGPVAYSFQGSNPYYTKLQVANTACGPRPSLLVTAPLPLLPGADPASAS